MKEYQATYYKTEVKSYKSNQSWKECKLQTYFITKGYINYFIVIDKENSKVARDFTLLIEPEKELFVKLEKDYSDMKGDIKE